MNTFVKAFLDHLKKEKKYSLNTLLSYEGDLEQLNSYIEHNHSPLEKGFISKLIEPGTVAGYLKTINEKRYAISTLARKIASIKSFFKYLAEQKIIREEDIPNLDSPQVNKSITKPLSISEIKQLMAEPGKSIAIEGKRDRAMLELLYATGLTASELMALDVTDIDYDNNSVLCAKRTKKRRVITTDSNTSHILREYINESRVKLMNNTSEVALFLNRRGERLTRQGFWQILQGYAEKVGLGKKVTPRSLRSSFVIHKLKSGADVEKIQELMGHAHISTTKAYQYLQ